MSLLFPESPIVYFLVFLLLLISEIVYFKVADRFNIIDKPNQRSSHTRITIRGGGIVFYLAAGIWFFTGGVSYPYFFLGLTAITLVSFIDDIRSLSNRIRILVQLASVLLMIYQIGGFSFPWYITLGAVVMGIGSINAYNFMDGINGITAAYSLAVGMLLILVNHSMLFMAQDLLIYTMIGVIIFAFFNFRAKAKCFAGDVGSVSIAFILLFAIGMLIVQTQNPIYILFLAVYGIDSVWTILRRLYLRENIFKAHRSHLFQFLANEAGVDKLFISFTYGALQLLVGLLVIRAASWEVNDQWLFTIVLLSVLSIAYLALKTYVIGKYVKENLAYPLKKQQEV